MVRRIEHPHRNIIRRVMRHATTHIYIPHISMCGVMWSCSFSRTECEVDPVSKFWSSSIFKYIQSES